MAYSLFQTLNISRQDMLSRLLDMDVLSNNLANVNTAGFKTSRSNFQELLTAANHDGVALLSTQIMTQQGGLRSTGNPLDWAIQGEGFFQVRLPGGEIGYSRDGQFHLDAAGSLVNSAGYALAWEGELPAGTADVTLLPNGVVQAILPDGSRVEAGAVELARFANPGGLVSLGNNVFAASEASGEPQTGQPGADNMGVLFPHSIEQSNVNLAEEMTNLINLQRSFQLSVRAFQQTDTMISQALHMRKA